jgi:hypothetical protein
LDKYAAHGSTDGAGDRGANFLSDRVFCWEPGGEFAQAIGRLFGVLTRPSEILKVDFERESRIDIKLVGTRILLCKYNRAWTSYGRQTLAVANLKVTFEPNQ